MRNVQPNREQGPATTRLDRALRGRTGRLSSTGHAGGVLRHGLREQVDRRSEGGNMTELQQLGQVTLLLMILGAAIAIAWVASTLGRRR